MPRIDALSYGARRALAKAWCHDALVAHAAVASRSRFALELLAVGAPASFVAQTQRAAYDGVRHARACFQLATAYAGEPVGPGPLPFARAVAISDDLARVAMRAAIEGCVQETLAALIAAERLEQATDAAVRRTLERIARDGARHAELGWCTVAWAVHRGGSRVRAAVARAFETAPHADLDDRSREDLRAHGRLDAATLEVVRRSAFDEVIRPCATRVLSAAGACVRRTSSGSASCD
ncbi:MAG TPA: ferritin-like domain-containing protein [Polyangiaceae bacterium]|nr:ferritin-like domain-containing protein [Polyangiaceae bacterium]